MNNIVLIGMPGAGKSTLGVQLAKVLGLGFIDTDVLIQQLENKPLQEIIEDTDYFNLRCIEEKLLLSLDCKNHVIATGGSAIYSCTGMDKLKCLGSIVFLDVAVDLLQKRIGDYSHRGIASDKGQAFTDIYAERVPLYKQYAQVCVNCGSRSQIDLIGELAKQFG